MSGHPYFQRQIQVSSAQLSRNDIERLFHIVESQLKKSVTIQIDSFQGDADKKDEFSARVREVFLISYRVNKPDGDSYAGNGVPDFSGDSFPEDVQSIYINTRIPFEARANFPPNNFMNIFLDFKRPSLAIDFLTMPSNPTANGSEITIEGDSESWVIETYHKINEFLKNKSSVRYFIHFSGVYDLYLYVFVFPMYLYLLWRIQLYVPNEPLGQSLVALVAIYLYSVLLVGLFGRLSFQYARWLYPLLEYESAAKRNTIQSQKLLIMAIFTGIGVAFLYDVLKNFLL